VKLRYNDDNGKRNWMTISYSMHCTYIV